MNNTSRDHLSFYSGAGTLALMGLVVIAFSGVAFGLSQTVAGLDRSWLVQVSIPAALVGWTLAGTRVRNWTGFPLVILLGPFSLLLYVSKAIGRLLPLIFKGGSLVLAVTRLGASPSAASYALYWEYSFKIYKDIEGVFTRLSGYFARVPQGNSMQDPLVMQLFWGFLVWIVFSWCAWALRRRFHTITAFLPALVVLGSTLAYANREPAGLVIVLGSILFLSILVEQIKRERLWQFTGTDFTIEIRYDLALVAVPLCAVLILIASIIPTLSIKQIAENIHNLLESRPEEVSPYTESLGLYRPTEIASSVAQYAPGLPRQHLLGTGPELSKRPVMVISTGELAAQPPEAVKDQIPAHYWRGLTFDAYTGIGWTTSFTTAQSYPANSRVTPAESQVIPADQPGHKVLHQKVRMIEGVGGVLHVAGDLITANAPFQVAWRTDNDAFAGTMLSLEFEADSSIVLYTEDQLRKTGQDYPAWLKTRYLDLPKELPEEVRSLAWKVTASAVTPYDQALAIQDYLRENYKYTLDLKKPPENRDLVDYFLFNLKKGYCDYFASAMVVMARSIGLPARIAVGFATGNYDALNADYVVTEADSHSWPEIYFPGYGWISFEPTPNRPTIKQSTSGLSMSGSRPSVEPLTTPTPAGGLDSETTALLVGVGLVFVILLGFGLLAWTWMRRLHRKVDPLVVISQIYQQMHNSSQRFELALPGGSTPYEFSQLFQRHLAEANTRRRWKSNLAFIESSIGEIVECYVRASYTSQALTIQEMEHASGLWTWLKWRLWWVWFKFLF